MLVLQRTLNMAEEVQIWTEYNVLSAQELVQNMACHAKTASGILSNRNGWIIAEN
jgi:hypothetical protein